MGKIITEDGVEITWEGELGPDTMVTLKNQETSVTVPVGSWIAMTNGEALSYINQYNSENFKS